MKPGDLIKCKEDDVLGIVIEEVSPRPGRNLYAWDLIIVKWQDMPDTNQEHKHNKNFELVVSV